MGLLDIFRRKKKEPEVRGVGSVLGGGATEAQQRERILNLPSIKKRVKRLTQRGELPEKIYSGGIVTDIFDTLNLLQYGVVGAIKGKGFAEGVRTRESFSKDDSLGEHGLPGAIAGVALDIAVDPLTYIAPISIFKKIPRVAKGVDALGDAFKATRLGGKIADEFTLAYGASKPFKEILKRGDVSRHVGIRNIVKMTEGIADLPAAKMADLVDFDDTGRVIRKSMDVIEKTGKFGDDELFKVARAWSVLDDLGKRAVDVGLLKEETWAENMGKYIKNAYTEYETGKGGLWGYARRGVKGIKKRKEGLTKETMEELGQIKNPAALMLKSSVDLVNDIENAKLLNRVAKNFVVETDEVIDGLRRMPNNPTRLRGLADKIVPEPIYKTIQMMTVPKSPTQKTLEKMVGKWKFGKVVLNPATHGRNIISNFILNSWEGLSPHRLDVYAEAAKEMARLKKGKPTKWVDEILPLGFDTNTFAAQELKELLIGGDDVIGGGKKALTKIQSTLSDLYGAEENWAKLAQHIFQRKQGKSIEEAWTIAQRATFNYAQAVPFVRKMRKSVFGYPFITFTAKATPQALKTMAKHPGRISAIGKIKNAIENQADLQELRAERKTEPSWIRNGFYVKLPFKDKRGRSAYFDMTYIIPFGDLITGEVFRRTPTFFNLVGQLARNEDFYRNKIFKETATTSQKGGDIMRHLMKFGLPTPVAQQIPGGWKSDGKRRRGTFARTIAGARGKEDVSNQVRTLQQELLRNVGLKIQPIDLETQEWWSEYEKDKAINTLLRESGYAKEYKTTYIPND